MLMKKSSPAKKSSKAPTLVPKREVKPKNWPSDVEFITSSVWAENISQNLREKYKPSIIQGFANEKVVIQKIDDPKHPAYGKRIVLN